MLARWTPAGDQAWYLADKQGTVRDVIDAAGAVVGTRSYDAFGRILGESGAVDRFAFQAREWDAGVALYQFRARWYDSVTRQFTSADPLGFAAGDWNTRRFVANNPLSGTDPSGLALADYVKLSATGALVGAAIGGYCGAIGAAIAAAADGQGWRVVLVQAGRGFIVGVILGAVAGSNPYGAVAVGAYGAGVLTVHPPRTTGDFVGLAVGFACGFAVRRPLTRWANGGAPKPKAQPVHIDIGGEGRYPGAVNVNPQPGTSYPGPLGPAKTPIPNRVPGVGEKLPQANQSADLITVENTPLRPGSPAEIARVIKPGGEIRLEHPAELAATPTKSTVTHQDVVNALPKGSTVTSTTTGSGDAANTVTIIKVPGAK